MRYPIGLPCMDTNEFRSVSADTEMVAGLPPQGR